jgi:uncharacterized protein (TIGR02453 family)
VADPRVSLYRIYRDTRFSADKSPLKTHVAAHFPSRRFPRGSGAGLYVEITPGWVWAGGGIYMPSTADLQAIRAQIASSHPRFHRTVTAPVFARSFGELGGERLTRVPRGYPKDHPAARYLQFKQFLAGCEFDAEFAVRRTFYPKLLSTFQAAAPLVRFLNTALGPTAVDEPRVAPAAPRAEPMW